MATHRTGTLLSRSSSAHVEAASTLSFFVAAYFAAVWLSAQLMSTEESFSGLHVAPAALTSFASSASRPGGSSAFGASTFFGGSVGLGGSVFTAALDPLPLPLPALLLPPPAGGLVPLPAAGLSEL